MRKRFVIHELHARNLHFDLRLEIGGVLKSWAIPKGPSLNPADKRLAVAVPDHSINYINCEGALSEGSYGAGEVRIWDSGKFEADDDIERQLEEGKLAFTFFGLKLRGQFVLIEMKNQKKNWLLVKAADQFADKNWKLSTVLKPKK